MKPTKSMSRKPLFILLIASTSFFFSGCATIMHGSRQGVFLTCEPRVAAVYIDGKLVGQTPMRVVLKRGKNHQLRMTLPGYKPFETELTRRLDGWAWGNIIGVVGIALDAYNGSMYRLKPKDRYPELTPLSTDSTANSLSIRIVLQADPAWEKIGQLTRN